MSHSISSSHGNFIIDSNGKINNKELFSNSLSEFDMNKINQFNLTEYFKTYPNEINIPSLRIDILDIGYWYYDKNGLCAYEEPDATFRKEIREFAKTQNVIR